MYSALINLQDDCPGDYSTESSGCRKSKICTPIIIIFTHAVSNNYLLCIELEYNEEQMLQSGTMTLDKIMHIHRSGM